MLLKLSKITRDFGQPILIETANVISMQKHPHYAGTAIIMTGGILYDVAETIDEIFRQEREHIQNVLVLKPDLQEQVAKAGYEP